MKQNSVLRWLVPVAALGGLVSSAAGLFWQAAGEPRTFMSVHGREVELYGRGLYRADSLFSAAAFRGTDAAMLFAMLPLLLLAWAWWRRGSLRGGFFLAGMLSVFAYNSASMALGAAYNPLFGVYIVYFSASFYALVVALLGADLAALPGRVSRRLPARGMAIFLWVAGAAPLFLWGSDIVASLLAGGPPELLGPYTTMFTHAVDIAIIVPAAALAGVLVWRREPLGWLLACVMLTLLAAIGLIVVGQTAMQLQAGIEFSPGQLVGFIGSWLVLAGLAAWLLVLLFRALPRTAGRAASGRRAAGGARA